jgi:hypothetical protein
MATTGGDRAARQQDGSFAISAADSLFRKISFPCCLSSLLFYCSLLWASNFEGIAIMDCEISREIRALRRENRIIRGGLIAAVALVSFVLLTDKEQVYAQQKLREVLSAKRLEIVDDRGKVRFAVEVSKDGSTNMVLSDQKLKPAIRLYAGKKKLELNKEVSYRNGMIITAEGDPMYEISARPGTAEQLFLDSSGNLRLESGVLPSGCPILSMYDGKNNSNIRIGVGEDEQKSWAVLKHENFSK